MRNSTCISYGGSHQINMASGKVTILQLSGEDAMISMMYRGYTVEYGHREKQKIY